MNAKSQFIYCDYRETFARREPKRPRRAGPIIAWDLETDPIPRKADDAMSVGLRYITIFGANCRVSERLDYDNAEERLAAIMGEAMESAPRKSRFVAWNANRFDTLFLLRAFVRYCPEYDVRPMEARQGGLRGARVFLRGGNPRKDFWDFCDGLAMTGIQSTLADFTKKFSSDVAKLEGVIDFEKESFDPGNPRHVAYAERDSEALYLAMCAAEKIVVGLTSRQFSMTIGGLGIRHFEANIPAGIGIRPVPDDLWDKLFAYGMRGGYVFVSQRHDGPAWQYDLNQAYAAAMRDQPLPAGSAIRTRQEVPGALGFYAAHVSRPTRSPVPFYCKSTVDMAALETYGEGADTFIASPEIETLRRHGWTVRVGAGFIWTQTFTMDAMVGTLEALRTTCRSNCQNACTCPSDPVGTICKYLGNNAYGKTAERLDKRVLVLSAGGKPEHEIPGAITDWLPHEKWLEGDLSFENFFVTYVAEVERRRYHRPHIAAFITAHVRMKVFDAIMQDHEAFRKADTDSVTFTRPVALDCDPKRYGAWKVEYEGTRAIIIGKKVYAFIDEAGVVKKAVCKGLNVRRLDTDTFEKWCRTGIPPNQSQVQMLGWRRGLPIARYRPQERRGTDFRKTAPHLFGDI